MAERALSRSARAAQINSSRNLFSRAHTASKKPQGAGKKTFFSAGCEFIFAPNRVESILFLLLGPVNQEEDRARFTAALKCAPLHLLWSGNLTTTLFKWPNLPRHSISRSAKRFPAIAFM
jgi:hypothetical protein